MEPMPYSDKRKTNLDGEVRLLPLLLVMGVAFFVSYVSFGINGVEGGGLISDIGKFGLDHIPIVEKSAGLATAPAKCAFVMTVQWAFLFLYVIVLIFYYNPFSAAMRAATEKWYATNPLPPSSGVRSILFLLFGLASVLADLRVLNFPTFFNGNFISYWPHNFVILGLINTPLLPLFSWFSVLSYVVIYWICLFVIANRDVFFD